MKKLLDFMTTLDRDAIIQTLKENTLTTENDFLTFIFSKHYFSGQVSDKKIRIRNAARSPKNPSPILDITIAQKDDLTEVVVQDDTGDEITTNTLMIQPITISISVVTLLIGGILSFLQPEKYPFMWTLIISFAIAGLSFINSYYYKETVKLNTRGDLEFIIRLLKR